MPFFNPKIANFILHYPEQFCAKLTYCQQLDILGENIDAEVFMAMATMTIGIDGKALCRINETSAERGMIAQETLMTFVAQRQLLPNIGIVADKPMKGRRNVTYEEGLSAFEALRAQAQASPLAGMSMEEIDAEIALYRAGK